MVLTYFHHAADVCGTDGGPARRGRGPGLQAPAPWLVFGRQAISQGVAGPDGRATRTVALWGGIAGERRRAGGGANPRGSEAQGLKDLQERRKGDEFKVRVAEQSGAETTVTL